MLFLCRLDSLEQRSTTVEDHLLRVDNSLQDMGTSMSAQFSAVMKGLADLAEAQRGGGADARKRPATQPFPTNRQDNSAS